MQFKLTKNILCDIILMMNAFFNKWKKYIFYKFSKFHSVNITKGFSSIDFLLL